MKMAKNEVMKMARWQDGEECQEDWGTEGGQPQWAGEAGR